LCDGRVLGDELLEALAGPFEGERLLRRHVLQKADERLRRQVRQLALEGLEADSWNRSFSSTFASFLSYFFFSPGSAITSIAPFV